MRIWEWKNKILILFGAGMIMVIWNQNTEGFFGALIFMFIYSIFGASYGYVINSYFDRIPDEQLNKYPDVRHFTKTRHFMILVVLGLLTFLMPFYYRNLIIVALGLTIFFLITFYSAPPIRFKERSFLGPLSEAFSEKPLPFLFFTFLIPSDAILTLFLFIWLCLIGLHSIIGHQLLDYENDLKTGIKTMPQTMGFFISYKITLVMVCISFLYIFTAPLIFGLVNGLALALTLSVFSATTIGYTISALGVSRGNEDKL
jgi:4-hydroxybenzoate polyprenyltransferase